MNELVSVIVPVYNVEKYLRRCVDSIIGQSYKELEIILVDDGSPDECPRICDEYSENDDRIRVIHKANGGLSDARNAGLDIATGKYICFIDSDDYVSKGFIEELYNTIITENVDISITDMVMVYGDGIEDRRGENSVRLYSKEEALRVMFLQKEFNNSAWGKMFRRELFADKRFVKGVLYEDFELVFRIMFDIPNVAFTRRQFYYYYQNSSSIMHQKVSERDFVIIDMAQGVLDRIKAEYPELIDAAYSRYLFSNFFVMDKIAFAGCRSKYLDTVKRIKENVKSNYVLLMSNKCIGTLLKIKATSFLIGYPLYRFFLSVNRLIKKGKL